METYNASNTSTLFGYTTELYIAEPNYGYACTVNADCGDHGYCTPYVNGTNGFCVCEDGYITVYNGYFETDEGMVCSYRLKDGTMAFVLSFILGFWGADWFYLARGHGGFIAGGVFKLLTCGGCGIWWCVDWIRILAWAFPDGHGIALRPY